MGVHLPCKRCGGWMEGRYVRNSGTKMREVHRSAMCWTLEPVNDGYWRWHCADCGHVVKVDVQLLEGESG